MSLKDKFNLSNDVWIDLIRNGVISCSVAGQENILACFKKHSQSGIEHSEAVKRTADEMNCTLKWVYEVLRRWG